MIESACLHCDSKLGTHVEPCPPFSMQLCQQALAQNRIPSRAVPVASAPVFAACVTSADSSRNSLKKKQHICAQTRLPLHVHSAAWLLREKSCHKPVACRSCNITGRNITTHNRDLRSTSITFGGKHVQINICTGSHAAKVKKHGRCRRGQCRSSRTDLSCDHLRRPECRRARCQEGSLAGRALRPLGRVQETMQRRVGQSSRQRKMVLMKTLPCLRQRIQPIIRTSSKLRPVPSPLLIDCQPS